MGLQKKFLAALTTLFCVFHPAVSSGHPCSALRKLENGQTFFRYGGLFATFSCRHGYRLHGHRTNSCVSGRWTREPPICVGSGCPRPDPVAHGSFRVNSDASWVEFSCDGGYKLIGASKLHCKGDEWSSSQPLCEEPDLMHSTVSKVTAQKPPVNPTLQVAVSVVTKAPSHHKTSTNLQDVAMNHLNTSNSSTNHSKPHPHQKLIPTVLNSSEKLDIQIYSTKQNELLLEPPTLLTPLTTPKKHIPTNEISTSIKTLSASFDSTSNDGLAKASQATTVLPSLHTQSTLNKTSLQNAATSRGENADQTTREGTQSHSQPFPQSPTPYPTVTHYQSTFGTTPSEINVYSSPTSNQASAPAVTPPELQPSTTLPNQATPQNVESSSKTEAEIDDDLTTQKAFQFQQPLQPSPTSNQVYSPKPTLQPSDKMLTTTLENEFTPKNVESSKTAEETDYPTTQNVFQSQQPVHQSPTTFASPFADTSATSTPPLTTTPSKNAKYSTRQTKWATKSGVNRTSSLSCPSPPAPVHGTVHFRDKDTSGPIETGHVIQYVCDHGFTLAQGDAERTCQEGATWSGVAPVCVDLDECALEQHHCEHICINTLGSFLCACHVGYQPSPLGTSCTDVDECAFPASVNGCLFGCVNTPGSFYCLCPSGYTLLSPDHALCQDIDECADNGGLGPCSERCHNTPGSFHCSCSFGFTLAGDGHTCIPECPSGYRKQPPTPHNSTLPSAGQCVDINECEDEELCEWKCINLPGTYRCICPKGHIPTQDGRGCRDIDECSRNNGGCSHICINRRGSYKCACPPSHRFSSYSWKNCVPRL